MKRSPGLAKIRWTKPVLEPIPASDPRIQKLLAENAFGLIPEKKAVTLR